MAEPSDKINLLDLDRAGLHALFIELGEKGFRADQLMKWVYHDGVDDFDAMTNFSKVLRARLNERCEVRLPTIEADQPSRDGTRKWLLRLSDGNAVEMVYIPDGERATLCVSSQAGCSLNCSFCSTARQGFNRNLTAGEMIAQLVVAQRRVGLPENRGERVLTNVVLMGMGEPLLNMEAVLPAMNIMQDDLAFGISKRRVTLSTAGVVPGIDRLLQEGGGVSLAVSLHAPDDALRDALVPINKKYPIAELMAACRRYIDDKPHRAITFEYVMLDGVNDTPKHARKLIAVLEGIPSKVNLIPFNPFPNSPYRTSTPEALARFQEILIRSGLSTMVRKTRGEDIDAACGQLAGKVLDRTRRSARHAGADIRSVS